MRNIGVAFVSFCLRRGLCVEGALSLHRYLKMDVSGKFYSCEKLGIAFVIGGARFTSKGVILNTGFSRSFQGPKDVHFKSLKCSI